MGVPKRDKDARKFARVAKQRLEEAQVIHENLRLWAAAQYLGGYAVECILKALVLVTTPSNKRQPSGEKTVNWLKREFGHDLDKLRSHLDRHGIRMSRDIAREFVFVSIWDTRLRYEPGPGDPDKTARFLSAAEAVLKWADKRMV